MPQTPSFSGVGMGPGLIALARTPNDIPEDAWRRISLASGEVLISEDFAPAYTDNDSLNGNLWMGIAASATWRAKHSSVQTRAPLPQCQKGVVSMAYIVTEPCIDVKDGACA
ncbi:MAG: hypothetical protein AAAC47_09255, partial [Pararhizobium sp.]